MLQKLLLKINNIDRIKDRNNLDFIKSFLSLFDENLNLLSIILLWSIESRVIKAKSSNRFILFFNNRFKSIPSIYTKDFSLYDNRNLEYEKINLDKENYFTICKDEIFQLSSFENHRISSIVESFKIRHSLTAHQTEDI